MPGNVVVVIGCGGIGLSTINGAEIAGAGRIIAVDVADNKLEMALRFGATDVVNASKVDPVQAVREMASGGVEHAFECIGLPLTARQAVEMLAPFGVATIMGVFPAASEISIPGEVLLQQRRVQGSFLGSALVSIDIPRLVEHYLRGRLKLDELVSKRIMLEDVNLGFEDMKGGKVARSVVVFPDVNT